jgi:hypothetical protein
MRTRPTFWEAASCVYRRPWPWVIRHVGALIPALLVALMLLIPLRSWLSQPLVAEALETRSLDFLVDALMSFATEVEGGLLLLAGVALIPLAWIGMRMLWLLLEGGVLVTYARPKRPTAREFLRACVHWFPSFLLISILAVLATGAVIVIAAVCVALIQTLSLWPSLATAVCGVGMAAIVGISVAAELARAAAVVGEDRNVWRAFGAAGRVVTRRAGPLVALILGALLLRGLLFLVQRALSGWIPISWWLLTLLVQQVLQVAITGVGLLRRAVEVALVFPLHHVSSSVGPFDRDFVGRLHQTFQVEPLDFA